MLLDIHTLLQRQKNIKSLLSVGPKFGIRLSSVIEGDTVPSAETVLNFGAVPFDELLVQHGNIPIGYEDAEDVLHVYERDIPIHFQRSERFSSFATATLKAWETFPKNGTGVPAVDLQGVQDSEDSELHLTVGDVSYLRIVFTMGAEFHGQLKRLLILHFEITDTEGDLITHKTELTMGAMVFATILPQGVDRSVVMDDSLSRRAEPKHALSAEARPFAPLWMVNMFDNPCPVICTSNTPQPHIGAFAPPPNYSCAMIHPALLAGAGFVERMAQEIRYAQRLRANQLEHIISALELCTVSDLLQKHSLSAASMTAYSRDMLSNYAKLTNLEEMQTKLDIAQYDLHHVKLRGELKEPLSAVQMVTGSGGTPMVVAKLKIPGSSENRPKICLGTEIFLRPVGEDLHKLSAYGWVPMQFELRGICTSYKLSTEEAAFEFPTYGGANFPFVSLFNSLRYDVRFDYERQGFLYVQWAIGNILRCPYLLESLYPSEETVSRVRTYFATVAMQSDTLKAGSPRHLQSFSPPGLHAAAGVQGGAHQYDGGVRSPAVQSLSPSGAGLSPTSTEGDTAAFNAQQLQAIETILHLAGDNRRTTSTTAPAAGGSGGEEGHLPMPPFVIYGPPGTGKTSTVAEAILRVCRRYPNKRILACAPSDAAADVLCERLARHLSRSQLFRLNWWQRVSASLPARLRPFSMDVDDVFELPPADVLLQYRVIVCNCGTAGVLKTLPLSAQMSFDLVFVDEASQAMEPEVLVPLELCAPGGVMVLAGDTNQLGPNTRCPLYPLCSDGASLQERLLRLPFYSHCWPENAQRAKKLQLTAAAARPRTAQESLYESMDSSRNTSAINLTGLSRRAPARAKEVHRAGGGDDLKLGVFLFQNYRSHRVLLEVPSQQFYAGALEERADRRRTEFLSAWDRMPHTAKGEIFPLLTIGVDGRHEHETGSPSFFNTAEIEKVVELCSDLVHTHSLPPGTVSAKDIGVIAAFRQQVLKLRIALRAAGLSNVSVGSVEDFQGQEMKIIVVSTVLTAWEDRYETKGAIGLFGDPRRFNVAVTRGMALCVVVGKPQMLYADPHWRELLKYCVANGGYTGMDITGFLRRPRARAASHHSTHSAPEHGVEDEEHHSTAASIDDTGASAWFDEDTELLNSIAEVANQMLQPSAADGQGSLLWDIGQVVRGYDMEWRNIM